MLIKKEHYTDEHGIPMVREYYGDSGDKITSTVETFAGEVAEPEEVSEPEEKKTDAVYQDEIFAQILLNQAELLALLKSNAGGNADV